MLYDTVEHVCGLYMLNATEQNTIIRTSMIASGQPYTSLAIVNPDIDILVEIFSYGYRLS